MVRLLRYSVCKICDNNIPYEGIGRPREYCDGCVGFMTEVRRVKWAVYMRKYRERRRKMIY